MDEPEGSVSESSGQERPGRGSIRIISTGGTFEKVYDYLNGKMIFKESCIPSLLLKARVYSSISSETVMLKDSLDLSEEDRGKVSRACEAATERSIVVIHGTDTMAETAKALGRSRVLREKCVVLTGAMLPEAVKHSEASFNLGFALGWAASGCPGIWVAMNGLVFSGKNVRKNAEKGVFEMREFPGTLL